MTCVGEGTSAAIEGGRCRYVWVEQACGLEIEQGGCSAVSFSGLLFE
jgi:hypothetical protein